MKGKEIKVYLAGGWFHPDDDRILTKLEEYLRSKDFIKPYFPRHDGVKLNAGEFHDPKLRERVFLDNIAHIDDADLVIANLDGRVCQDTGTCYEVGYAMARNIPVIGYQDDSNGLMTEQLASILDSFNFLCVGISDLDMYLNNFAERVFNRDKNVLLPKVSYEKTLGSKVLFIAPDNTDENIKNGTDVANVLIECFGKDFRWVDSLSNKNIQLATDDIFDDIKFMLAVIDDKHPIVSWMMGQCFARKIPMISYTNYNWDINIMLLCSIKYHVKGIEELKKVIQDIKRNGIDNLPKFDSSNIKAY